MPSRTDPGVTICCQSPPLFGIAMFPNVYIDRGKSRRFLNRKKTKKNGFWGFKAASISGIGYWNSNVIKCVLRPRQVTSHAANQ